MSRQIVVGATQIPVSNDVDANLEAITAAARDAAKQHVQILCTPETSLTGEKPLELGQLTAYHESMIALAYALNMTIIYSGYVVEEETYNACWVVDPEGNRFEYIKQHLWKEDDITPGTNASPVINLGSTKIGLRICWDLPFVEDLRDLAKRGAEIVFCPAFWFGEQYDTVEVIEALPLAAAFIAQVYIVLCDANNPETAKRSRICSPLHVLAQAPAETALITATLDLELIARGRSTFDCWSPKSTL